MADWTCPETPGANGQPIACSTAYGKYGCRCETCREWQLAGRPPSENDQGNSTALTRQRDAAIERIGETELYRRVAAGLTLRQIALELGLPDSDIAAERVRDYLRRDEARYSEAKRASADALAEKAGRVFGEEAPETNPDAKWRADRSGYYRWLSDLRAGRNTGGVNVQLDIGALHLDALKAGGRMRSMLDEPGRDRTATEALEAEIVNDE